MSADDSYLALFIGSRTSPAMAKWNALPEAERQAKQQEGVAAWKAWMEQNQSALVGTGGPLGRTKKISSSGIEDTSNAVSAYVVVRAESHQAATRLFEGHPHFSIFPGECVEVMPILPIPGA